MLRSHSADHRSMSARSYVLGASLPRCPPLIPTAASYGPGAQQQGPPSQAARDWPALRPHGAGPRAGTACSDAFSGSAAPGSPASSAGLTAPISASMQLRQLHSGTVSPVWAQVGGEVPLDLTAGEVSTRTGGTPHRPGETLILWRAPAPACGHGSPGSRAGRRSLPVAPRRRAASTRGRRSRRSAPSSSGH